MIPPPKLDDRTFHDIVEEAISMIPRYAPEWTNHNPSDPGITLIELAAWMTDLLIYRLNQVPDKNYVAFLNLLGIKLRPPRAAQGARAVHARRGRAEAARSARHAGVDAAGDRGAHGHVRDRARRAWSRPRAPTAASRTSTRRYAENSRYIDPRPARSSGAFEVFAGAQRIERFLYLSDPRFANTGDASLLRVFLGTPERGGRDLARLLEWEYWDGTRWKELEPAQIEVDRGEVAFLGPLRFEPTTVQPHRGSVDARPPRRGARVAEDTEIDTIRARVEVVGEGLLPTQAFANLDNNAFLPLDLGKNIYPFGKEPKVDCLLYLACDELLQTRRRVHLDRDAARRLER